MKKKNKKYPAETNSNELLYKELTYGPHGKHKQNPDDNITGHHMPSNQFMQDNCNKNENESWSMNLEHIFPGKGGRHKRTFTYGKTSKSRDYQLYNRLTPRDALAFDMYDIKRILKEDGLYNKDTRKQLINYINEYKNDPKFKKIFDKNSKLNKESSRVKSCKNK